MDAIINDVEAMAKFRNDLLDTVKELESQLKKTEGVIDDVAKTWKDIQFVKFHEGFDEDKGKIEPLCKAVGEFESEVLYPLEQDIREYLNQ